MVSGNAQSATREETTSEKQFRLKENSFWRRRQRDWFVFRYLARLVWMWATVGRRIRRTHQEAKQTGNIYYIDNIMGGGDV